jgi:hypothetical protein
MADEIAATPAAAEQVQETQGQPENAAQLDAPASGEQAARTFTQADVDRMIADRLDRERKHSETKAQKAREEAERKAAEEQGQYQKLYEAEKAKAAAAEQKARELELAGLRRDAAAKYALPAKLAERLKGETLEELEADAKDVAAALPKPAAPNINATGGATSHSAADDDALTAQAVRLGIKPELYRQQYKGF